MDYANNQHIFNALPQCSRFVSCGCVKAYRTKKYLVTACKDGLKPINFHGRKDYLRTNRYLYFAEISLCNYILNWDKLLSWNSLKE